MLEQGGPPKTLKEAEEKFKKAQEDNSATLETLDGEIQKGFADLKENLEVLRTKIRDIPGGLDFLKWGGRLKVFSVVELGSVTLTYILHT